MRIDASRTGRCRAPGCAHYAATEQATVTITEFHGNDPGAQHAEVLDLEEARTSSLPPHSLQAEEAVLGSVLKNPLAITEVLPFLKPQHFYKQQNRHVYAAMAALFERAAAIDFHTIAEEL